MRSVGNICMKNWIKRIERQRGSLISSTRFYRNVLTSEDESRIKTDPTRHFLVILYACTLQKQCIRTLCLLASDSNCFPTLNYFATLVILFFKMYMKRGNVTSAYLNRNSTRYFLTHRTHFPVNLAVNPVAKCNCYEIKDNLSAGFMVYSHVREILR
jgi:hypothetical protein